MKSIKYTLNALLLTLLLAFSLPSLAQAVNVNTADAQTLADSLNGIGIKKASAIIQWRTEHGNFASLDDLDQVKGIGPKILARNKDDIEF
jgi:competence protein ComEA